MVKRFSFDAPRMDLGLDLNSDRNLKYGQISDGRSARYQPGSAIYTGPGYRLVADLGTATTVYLFETSVFPLLWAKSGTKLLYSTDPQGGTFYDTGVTLTSSEKPGYCEQGNGDIHETNQTDSNVRVAVARNTVAVADSDVTITVGTDWITKFAASGTVYIRGDSIAYTGVNAGAGTLTGVTGIQTGGHPINSVVSQTSNPSTWTSQKGTFAFELESRMVVGGRLHYENILYASAPEDASNPAFFYDFSANGTVNHIFNFPLVGGIKGQRTAYIFGKKQIVQLSGFDVSTGAMLTQPIDGQYGAYNPRCIVNMDGTVAFFGNKRLIPVELTLGITGSFPSFNQNFDAPIRPWLDALDPDTDQGSACLTWNATLKILKIKGSRNGALETRVYDAHTGNFLPLENRPTVSQAMFGSNSYIGGNDGKVYRDDISRTNNGVAILHSWVTGRMEHPRRQNFQTVRLRYEGYMNQSCEHTVKVYVNGSSEASGTFTFTDSLITTSQGIAIGSRGVGASPVSGGDDGESAYRYENDVLLRGLSAEDIRVEWTVTKEGSYFQVNSFSLEYDVTRFTQRTSS